MIDEVGRAFPSNILPKAPPPHHKVLKGKGLYLPSLARYSRVTYRGQPEAPDRQASLFFLFYFILFLF